MAIRVYVEQAGCNRRQLDLRTIRAYLEANGYVLVSSPAEADRIIVATCAFKKKEEEESVRRIRSLRRYEREIVVYGCLPDIAGERYPEFSDLPAVAPRTIDEIERHFEATGGVPFDGVRQANVIDPVPVDLTRIRRRIDAGLAPAEELLHQIRTLDFPRLRKALGVGEEAYYLFVARGCLGSCSYCAIRRSIGPVQSKSADQVVAEFEQGLSEGHRTFTILGDDPGCYGLDDHSTLPDLLERLFEASIAAGRASGASPNGKPPVRFRLREIHPKFLIGYRDRLLSLPDLCLVSDILVPMQSGSDRVLGLMQREHRVADLVDAVSAVRARCPETTFETQIIVGFPSETEAEFRETLERVKEAGFDSVVVFPYHDKEGTDASRIPGKIAEDEIDRRMRIAFRFLRHEGIRAYYNCP